MHRPQDLSLQEQDDLRLCETVWDNIVEAVCNTEPPQGQVSKPVSNKDARKMLQRLRELLDIMAKPEPDLDPPALSYMSLEPQGKAGVGVFTGGPEDRSKKRRAGAGEQAIRPPTPPLTNAQVMEKLTYEGESKWLTLHDEGPITIRSGLLKPPCVMTSAAMIA